MYDNYGASNRQVIRDKTVSYSRQRIYGAWSYVDQGVTVTIDNAWEYQRVAKKYYKYVGMTRAAANTCAAAMITKYTRDTSTSKWATNLHEFTDETSGNLLMADVTVVHTGGTMWEVEVQVSELDVKIRTTALNPTAIFSNENGRDYDDGSASYE